MKTIKEEIVFTGIGIHSGHPVHLRLTPCFKPGITFVRTDCENFQIPLSIHTLSHTARATLLTKGSYSIKTPEHLLAACQGHGVSGLTVYLDAEELPILDGSAKYYSDAFLKVGFHPIESLPPIVIQKPFSVLEDGCSVLGFPDSEPRFSYFLSYPNSILKEQFASFSFRHNFNQEIAPARTFGFLSDLETLHQQGLAKGANLDCVLGIDTDGYLSALRMEEEPARHKLLDLMGDTWVFHRPIQGHIVGIKSGHDLSAKWIKQLSNLMNL